MPLALSWATKRRRINSHDGGDGPWRCGQHGVALRSEVGRRSVAQVWRHWRPPLREEFSQSRFVDRVTSWRRVADPGVELESGLAEGAHVFYPAVDFLGLHQEHAARAERAGVLDRDGERWWSGAGHWCEQDRHSQSESGAEVPGSVFGCAHFGAAGGSGDGGVTTSGADDGVMT